MRIHNESRYGYALFVQSAGLFDILEAFYGLTDTGQGSVLKFPGIAATAAEVFGGFALAEAIHYGLCTGGS